MGLFSKSDKDQKDKNRNVSITLYNVVYRTGGTIQIIADISHFKDFLGGILSVPKNKQAVDYLKEKYGKDIDEKEIEKVFLLYMLIITFTDVLEAAAKYLNSFSTLGSLGYHLYKDENILGGKLDQKTFMELIVQINEYAKNIASNKNTDEKTDQKSEQPK